MTADRQRVEDLEDVKTWIAEHDGRIDAWWQEQHRFNERAERCMKDIETRLTALEKRVMWLSGVAAMVGSIVGALIV